MGAAAAAAAAATAATSAAAATTASGAATTATSAAAATTAAGAAAAAAGTEAVLSCLSPEVTVYQCFLASGSHCPLENDNPTCLGSNPWTFHPDMIP